MRASQPPLLILHIDVDNNIAFISCNKHYTFTQGRGWSSRHNDGNRGRGERRHVGCTGYT